MFSRKDSKTSAVPENASELCNRAIVEFKKKSDHNKRESLNCFIAAMLGTLGAPLFVTLGEEMSALMTISPFFLSKLLPSLLSIIAAFATAWLQLRNPQRLWTIYRTAQRELEEHHRAYKFNLSEFSMSEERDKLLAEKVTSVYKKAHEAWLPLVPSPPQKTDSRNDPH